MFYFHIFISTLQNDFFFFSLAYKYLAFKWRDLVAIEHKNGANLVEEKLGNSMEQEGKVRML
jgi:hypothetical protein